MADRSSNPLARHGHVSYLEIPAENPKRAAAFCQAVFGWQIRGADTDRPSFEESTGQLIGRGVTGRPIAREPGMMFYVYVTGIDETVARIATHGGTLVKPPHEEGDIWVATFRDPEGNLMGIWQFEPR